MHQSEKRSNGGWRGYDSLPSVSGPVRPEYELLSACHRFKPKRLASRASIDESRLDTLKTADPLRERPDAGVEFDVIVQANWVVSHRPRHLIPGPVVNCVIQVHQREPVNFNNLLFQYGAFDRGSDRIGGADLAPDVTTEGG